MDAETVRRVLWSTGETESTPVTDAYVSGYVAGLEAGRQQMWGDWIVVAVIIAFAIVISGWWWA